MQENKPKNEKKIKNLLNHKLTNSFLTNALLISNQPNLISNSKTFL